MSETARILRFPERRVAEILSPVEISARAKEYLAFDAEGRSAQGSAYLSNADVLIAITRTLRDLRNSQPAMVYEHSVFAYRWLGEDEARGGLFDERDFFMGEFALLAAITSRLLGQRDEAERWIDRADIAFRHTVNPAPSLAQIAYVRLGLAYDRRRYDDILEIVPSVLRSFERLGLAIEVAKTKFLEAKVLKESSRPLEARRKLEDLAASIPESLDRGLLGRVFVELAGSCASDDDIELSLRHYERATQLLCEAKDSAGLAHLQMTVGETLRNAGRVHDATAAFREAVQIYSGLEMIGDVAWARIALADALVRADRPREAEWEILQALPTIEEQKMVPEGFAAVALLRESVKRRKADPNALRELREHLQKQK
jgi:tetratricopeptide (TPR) repeat protein